jgi:hypothetical protein
MAWKLDGTYFENCNCEMVCPCTTSGMAAKATYDRCKVLIVFHIDRGQIEGTDVNGLTIGVVADTPPVMIEGNWRVGILMDDKATKEQEDKIAAVFGGQKGGPMGAAGPLIGEMLGMERVPMKYSSAGREHKVQMGPDVHAEVEDYVGGGQKTPAQLVGVAHPVNTTLTIARGTDSHIKAFGIDFEPTGKSAFSAPFSWQG